jgi:hypothetical protein
VPESFQKKTMGAKTISIVFQLMHGVDDVIKVLEDENGLLN